MVIDHPDEEKTPGPEELRQYYELMLAKDLLELEIKDKDFYLKLSRQRAGAALPAPTAAHHAPAAPAKTPAVPSASSLHALASPLAGIFYRSPSPESPVFVKEGDKIAFGDVLCIVEAMKVMNEIRADRPGVLRKIAAENGKPVSAGQDLFLIEPA